MTVSNQQLANALRALAMDAVEAAKSGHPGMPMGMADVATVLFKEQLKFSSAAPHWHDRDRFVLSAGHGSMLLYGLLYLTGYNDFTLDEIKNFRQLNARTAGHPEYGHGAGIETTTGPLGQGLANAVGMALAERLLAGEYGQEICDHHTWVIAGDGCLMEGISHEAASFAGHLQLAKLTVLFDDNNICIDGDTAMTVSEDTIARFAAYGWNTDQCDGHDAADISRALAAARMATRPTLIACRTKIGYGAPKKQGTAAAHGSPLGADELAAAKKALQCQPAPFEIPTDILNAWRAIGSQHDSCEQQWQQKLAAHPQAEELKRRLEGELPAGWDEQWQQWRDSLRSTGDNSGKKMATRQASAKALEKLVPTIPALLGGSADLTGSNLTHVGQSFLTQAADGTIDGRYVHYGVREHGMAAVMNGLALHGGLIPYGGTFLVFSDYCRPAIRLAALMQTHVVYVFTHDSVGLGEDGPTHQPVEHLASLRLIPGLTVFRPCDTAETAECWHLALTQQKPAVLALSRQGLPAVSGDAVGQCARGAYVLADCPTKHTPRQLTIAASGSEVELALQTQQQLAADGIAAAVVSVPSMELFATQSPEWQQQVLPPQVPLLAIEAASTMPWQALAATAGIRHSDYVCMDRFGLSAPAAAAFAELGFSVEACCAKAHDLVKRSNDEAN
ncbi:MAG: transketolase [Proteobacteria bacterium]|nr:transketolase [Pseudomonadota bacterium]